MNGYFQLMNDVDGTGIKLIPPADGGEALTTNELAQYLTEKNIAYDVKAVHAALINLKKEPVVVRLQAKRAFSEQEALHLYLSPDRMEARARFYAPSNDGNIMDKQEILNDLIHQGVVFGVDEKAVDEFVKKRNYCEDIVIARGKPPVHGTDASIEYFFNTDLKARPTLNEDGSVDFFHLNTINHCRQGELLARLTPEDPGEAGKNVTGERVPPRDVKRLKLQYGNNITLSEDGRELHSMVNGHVTLVEERVFVSDVFEVENVDNSTGNIDYEGSVQINGNVCSNFSVKAKGNVEVRGVVEGAQITAGGDVIIARGVNGMSKGMIQAGGNVISKFIENATVSAGGYVESGSILHSRVTSQSEIHVDGKRGFITGGRVCATNSITVKTLGSAMGADTIVDVGVNPEVKLEFQAAQKQLAEVEKTLKSIQPVLASTTQKLKQGVKFPPEQAAYIKTLLQTNQQKQEEQSSLVKRMEELQKIMEGGNDAQVVVTGEVYPGTRIGISDVSLVVKDNRKYCRFVKRKGDVTPVGM